MAVDGQAPLAPFAASEATSRGRVHPEPHDAHRSLYQRDCDRIIHCAAFRVLENKTQVMVNHSDGLFRTRLTHSMEVAKLSRGLARELQVNEDLCEAVALAHDLGHTPFGHWGQDAMSECMKPYGGFEHNLQTLRIVDEVEHKYADFPGLNLTFETREGVLKRCPVELIEQMGELGERFRRKHQPTLEAQLVDAADFIAYTNHDLDDGLNLGMFTLAEACELELYQRFHSEVRAGAPKATPYVLQHEINRRMINAMLVDLIEATQTRLAQHTPTSPQQVREAAEPLAAHSPDMRKLLGPVTQFLHQRYYYHDTQQQVRKQAIKIIGEMFECFMHEPKRLPASISARIQDKEARHGRAGRARVVADHLASLSDRQIASEYERQNQAVTA